MIGKVKWFNNEKGFGFIENEKYKDIFVHYSSIIGDRPLLEGQFVEFELIRNYKGIQTKKIYGIDSNKIFILKDCQRKIKNGVQLIKDNKDNIMILLAILQIIIPLLYSNNKAESVNVINYDDCEIQIVEYGNGK